MRSTNVLRFMALREKPGRCRLFAVEAIILHFFVGCHPLGRHQGRLAFGFKNHCENRPLSRVWPCKGGALGHAVDIFYQVNSSLQWFRSLIA